MLKMFFAFMLGLTVGITAEPACAKPQGQQETLAEYRNRSYVKGDTVYSNSTYAPYSNREQAKVRRAERIVEKIERSENPGFYVFKTQSSRRTRD